MSEKPGLCRFQGIGGWKQHKCEPEDPDYKKERLKDPKEVDKKDCVVKSPDGNWVLSCPDPASGQDYCDGVPLDKEGYDKMVKLTNENGDSICVLPSVFKEMQKKYNIDE